MMFEFCLSLLLLLIVTIVLLYNKYVTKLSPQTGVCNNPSCVRCSGDNKFTKDVLLHRFRQYMKAVDVPLDLQETVKAVVNSLGNQDDIQRETLAISGYSGRVEPVLTWKVPGLTRRSFWRENEHAALNEVGLMFRNKDIIDGLLKEYEMIKNNHKLWSVNQTPKGKWKIFMLVNQGVLVDGNCDRCPVALEILSKLKCFMIGNTFCYAMFSSLEPGSIIEPHIGPCNFRVRCHVPLNAPKGFWLKVGKDSFEWKKGELVMFDDSLVHSVESDSGCADCRTVFIIDIWHPEVNQGLQEALNALFPANSSLE